MPENRSIAKVIGLIVCILVLVALFIVFGMHLGNAAALVVWILIFVGALGLAIFLL